MSANPDLRVCHIDKAQSSLVDFVAEMKSAFENNRHDPANIAHAQAVDWARSLLRSSQDVRCSEEPRQALIDDLRSFVKEIRKIFTKHEHDLHTVEFDPLIKSAQDLLDRSGHSPLPSSPQPRRMTH